MLVRILPAAVLFAFIAAAQPAEQVVTNSDVTAMIRAGLAQNTILNAIDLAARRGTTRFDVSPEALIRMKNDGASPAVLDAMIAAASAPKRLVPSTTVPGLPTAGGVYYPGPAGMVEVPAVVLWPEVQMGWVGLTPTEQRRYVLVGPKAGFRIRAVQPVFYVRGGPPDNYWQLVRLKPNKKSRVWETEPSQMPLLTEPLRIRTDQAVGLEQKRLANDVIELRPVEPLAPGQYTLVSTKSAQRWLSTAYPFAVVGEPSY